MLVKAIRAVKKGAKKSANRIGGAVKKVKSRRQGKGSVVQDNSGGVVKDSFFLDDEALEDTQLDGFKSSGEKLFAAVLIVSVKRVCGGEKCALH